jgi:hypothetical protein
MARELAEKWRLSARGPDVEPVSGETQLP